MFRRSKNLILTRPFANAILGAIVTAAPLAELLDTATLHLFQEGTLLGPDTTDPAVFTECDFDGYAAAAIAAWIGPANAGAVGRFVHFEANFLAGAGLAGGGQGARGYWIESGGVVMLGENWALNEHVNFGEPGAFLSLDAVLPVLFGVTVPF